MATIKTIIDTSNKIISPHKYKLENTRDSAKTNTQIFKKDRYNLTKALHRERGSMMEPGSEFRYISKLKPLLQEHENWEKMESIILEGMKYILDNLPEKV